MSVGGRASDQIKEMLKERFPNLVSTGTSSDAFRKLFFQRDFTSISK